MEGQVVLNNVFVFSVVLYFVKFTILYSGGSLKYI